MASAFLLASISHLSTMVFSLCDSGCWMENVSSTILRAFFFFVAQCVHWPDATRKYIKWRQRHEKATRGWAAGPKEEKNDTRGADWEWEKHRAWERGRYIACFPSNTILIFFSYFPLSCFFYCFAMASSSNQFIACRLCSAVHFLCIQKVLTIYFRAIFPLTETE